MRFDVEHDGRKTERTDLATALALGYPRAVAVAALKGEATAVVAQAAETYRAKLASTSAGKLAAYRVKEEIAASPATASPVELALIEREANARGITRDELIARIAAQAAAYRQISLLIEVIEIETRTSINAVSDAAEDIEVQITNTLYAAEGKAQAALTEAISLIEGAS